MKNAIFVGLTALLLLSLLPGCVGKHTAALRLTSRFENTMIYIPEGEREPEPEPVWETVTVSPGDRLMNGILTVKRVSRDAVTLKADHIFAGATYQNGHLVRQFDAGKALTLHRGEELRLTDIAILDASHTITIIWDAD